MKYTEHVLQHLLFYKVPAVELVSQMDKCIWMIQEKLGDDSGSRAETEILRREEEGSRLLMTLNF